MDEINDGDAKGDVSLSERQLALMRVLWTRGRASTAEVAEAMREQQRPLAHTTVAWFAGHVPTPLAFDAAPPGRYSRIELELDGTRQLHKLPGHRVRGNVP